MPLPPPVPRKAIHHRTVQCDGYLRKDGLWDIEGRIVDVKTYSFHNTWRGQVNPGTAVHDMSIRLTLDGEFIVREVAATMDANPYSICPGIVANFNKLVGLRVGKGWGRKTRELLGGIQGCTHLLELLGPVATTAFQSIYSYQAGRGRDLEEATSTTTRPPVLNTCHAWSDTGEVVKRWAPQFYREKN